MLVLPRCAAKVDDREARLVRRRLDEAEVEAKVEGEGEMG
tara:strand:+ start:242 stop:361 length:120 start_codon:yes stop_codon:yes gene_type:complete